jgi:hypothetical protein
MAFLQAILECFTCIDSARIQPSTEENKIVTDVLKALFNAEKGG